MYQPYTHKTEYRKKKRILAIGPRAQAILAPYLVEKVDDAEAFLFSPKDTQRLQKVEKRRKRKFFNKQGRIQPSQINRAILNPSRSPRTRGRGCSSRSIWRC